MNVEVDHMVVLNKMALRIAQLEVDLAVQQAINEKLVAAGPPVAESLNGAEV